MPNLIGQTLLDQYRVDSFIAAGGMGSVYLVWDLKRNVFLAMKVLHADPNEDPSLFRRFQREAEDLRKLAHPNIVPFYGLYQSGNTAFLLERYIKGFTLKDLLQQQNGIPLPLAESLAYLRALCSALGYAHINHIIHCDVKPGNVMIDQGRNVFLTDFGIARHTDSATTTFGTAGTPLYMAPEQIRGEKLSPAADIYALGVMFFEILTGRRPFRGDEIPEDRASSTVSERIMQAHLRLPPPDPLLINPSLPPALAQVILCCLAKDPQERFQTMEDFYQAALKASALDETTLSGYVALQTQPTTPQEVVPPATLVEGSKRGTPRAVQNIHPAATTVKPATSGRRFGLLWPAIGMALIFGLGTLGLLYLFSKQFSSQAPGAASLADRLTASQTRAESGAPNLLMTNTPTQDDTLSKGTGMQVSPTFTPAASAKPPLTPTPSPPPDEAWGRIVWTCQIHRNEENEQICLMDVDQPGEWQAVTSSAGKHRYASLSPDGKSVVYASNASGEFQIYEIDLANRVEQRINYDFIQADGPEISPDGRWIVFSGQSEGDMNLGIWVMDRNGGQAQRLFYEPGNDARDPTWSPEGSQILFAYGPNNDNRHLYIMEQDGSNVHPVSQEFLTRGRSDWSPDGLHIVGYTGSSWKRTLILMLTDGSDLHQVGDILNSQGPSFSPDGQWIAFTGYTINQDTNSCEIFIMRLDGSEIQRITENDYCDYQPRWGK